MTVPKRVVDIKKLIRARMQVERGFANSMLSSIDDATQRFEKAATKSKLPADVLADEHVENRAFHVAQLEMLIVWAYHWCERELKLMLARQMNAKASSTARTDMKKLRNDFGQYGIDLTTVTQWSSVELAREFCNSWKHNPLRPSPMLLRSMGISPKKHAPRTGLLADEKVRAGLCRKLSLSKGTTEEEIVKRVIADADTFLSTVLSLCTFGTALVCIRSTPRIGAAREVPRSILTSRR